MSGLIQDVVCNTGRPLYYKNVWLRAIFSTSAVDMESEFSIYSTIESGLSFLDNDPEVEKILNDFTIHSISPQSCSAATLPDSPLSSPSSSDTEVQQQANYEAEDTTSSGRDKPILKGKHVLGKIPPNVRLPIRKGGMHLWQFLYAMLLQPIEYSNLIEWTSNQDCFEFRLLEPEAIAMWWGYHKNKKNMSYDKLSRSLRYYYDKCIIRKMSGERYVYRFCIDPELMYSALGNSENRPQLKPLPETVQFMLLGNQPTNNRAEEVECLTNRHQRKRSSPEYSPVSSKPLYSELLPPDYDLVVSSSSKRMQTSMFPDNSYCTEPSSLYCHSSSSYLFQDNLVHGSTDSYQQDFSFKQSPVDQSGFSLPLSHFSEGMSESNTCSFLFNPQTQLTGPLVDANTATSPCQNQFTLFSEYHPSIDSSVITTSPQASLSTVYDPFDGVFSLSTTNSNPSWT